MKKQPTLDWEDLHHFAVFAREGSLAAAARHLNVEHATVARRIAALEAALNLKLVDRRPRAYVLTPDGQRINEVAARMDAQTDAVARIAKAGQQELAGEVTLTAPPGLSNAMIAPRLDRLRAEYPGIRLRLIGETRIASLPRREADLAIRLSRPVEDELVARKIAEVRFGFYASPAYLAAHTPEQYEFIAYDESMENSGQQRWLKESAGDRAIVLRTNDIETQRTAAQAGAGVAALPDYLGEQGGFERVDLGEPAFTRDVWIAVHADMRHVPAVRAVMDFLVACFSTPGELGRIVPTQM